MLNGEKVVGVSDVGGAAWAGPKTLVFAVDAELDVVRDFDLELDAVVEGERVTFLKDAMVTVDVIGDMGDTVYIQFPDGSVAAGVGKDIFVAE